MEEENEIDIELIWRKIYSSLTDEEEEEFAKWLAAEDSHREYFEKAKILYGRRTSHPVVEEEEHWEAMQRKIKRPQLRRTKTKWLYFTAACLVLAAGIFITINTQDQSDAPITDKIVPGSEKATLVTADGRSISLEDQSLKLIDDSVAIASDGKSLVYGPSSDNRSYEENTLIVPRGGKFQVTLADGTIVHLNSETQLVYPVGFNSERTVRLAGEAYFVVAKDPSKPFRVITAGPTVTALGTEFNISSHADKANIVTTLVEGSVRVAASESSMVLMPGEQAIYTRNSKQMTIRQVEADLYTGWVEDVFIFEDENLEELMSTLSRWYDVDVFFVSATARQLKFTGEIERYEQIETILKLIEKTHVVKFDIKGRTVIIN